MLVALDHRLELREPLHRGVAQALVARDRLRLPRGLTVVADHRRVDRRDLALEPAFVPRDLRLALRVEAPLVEVLAGDAAVVGDALGRAELAVGRVVVGVVVGLVVAGTVDHVRAQRHVAHRLDAAPDRDVGAAGRDERRRPCGWPAAPSRTARRPWCTRCCSRGERCPSHALRVTFEPCSPAWVTQPPMTSSTSAGSMPARSITSSWTRTEDLGRLQAREPAVALADRRADGFDDDRRAHGVLLRASNGIVSLESVLVLGTSPDSDENGTTASSPAPTGAPTSPPTAWVELVHNLYDGDLPEQVAASRRAADAARRVVGRPHRLAGRRRDPRRGHRRPRTRRRRARAPRAPQPVRRAPAGCTAASAPTAHLGEPPVPRPVAPVRPAAARRAPR